MARLRSHEVTVVLRIGLAILAAAAWMIGVWNQFLPEHYARDYGGANLGGGDPLKPRGFVRIAGSPLLRPQRPTK
jgi:hypothetical protein